MQWLAGRKVRAGYAATQKRLEMMEIDDDFSTDRCWGSILRFPDFKISCLLVNDVPARLLCPCETLNLFHEASPSCYRLVAIQIGCVQEQSVTMRAISLVVSLPSRNLFRPTMLHVLATRLHRLKSTGSYIPPQPSTGCGLLDGANGL